MDGLADDLMPLTQPIAQVTLRQPIDCVGTGLHSGRKVSLRLVPAAAGTGIRFRRTDLAGGPVEIPARFDHVVDTTLCTVLAAPDRPDSRTGTVEHVMAALVGAGVSNAVVELDGPEVPVMDGSAEPFTFLIDCAGRVEQGAAAPVVEVLRPVRVAHGPAFAELRPAGGEPAGLRASVSIVFAAGAIGRQSLSLAITPESFRTELARARTFTERREIDRLHAAGLALGGSLANAVVVDDDRVMNPGGLRMGDEFVRHKMLDMVGDLGLAGAVLQARLVAHRPGHALNNQLLRALFADPANWRWATPARDATGGPAGLSGWQEARLPVAAAPL